MYRILKYKNNNVAKKYTKSAPVWINLL